MTCAELGDSYELYALGVAEDEEKIEMEAHMARGCETCRQGLADATALNVGILNLSEIESPPSRLKRRVMAAAGVEKPGWGWVWALSSAGLLLLTLWLGLQERTRTNELAEARGLLMNTQSQRDRLNQALQFLSDPQTQPASFGRGANGLTTAPPRGYVFLHPQMGVLLIASNLPAAGAGKAYEMWVIPKGGAPRPAGLFQSNGTRALHILSGPLDMAMLGAVAVTLEPEAGSAAPTSTPIIVANAS